MTDEPTPATPESTVEALRVVWSWFVAIEQGDDEVIEAIWQMYTDDEFMYRGWHLVAARLRQELLAHASDCDCGSDAWLERVRLRNFGLDAE